MYQIPIFLFFSVFRLKFNPPTGQFFLTYLKLSMILEILGEKNFAQKILLLNLVIFFNKSPNIVIAENRIAKVKRFITSLP